MRSRQIQLLAILAFAVLLGVGAFAFQQLNLLKQYSKQVDINYRTFILLEDVLSHSKDVETGARGYVVTGDTMFLEPYYRGKQNIQRNLDTLHNEYALHWPEYLSWIDSICVSLERQIALSTEVVSRAREGTLNPENLRRLLLMGKLNMDSARRYAGMIRSQQQIRMSLEKQQLSQQVENVPAYVVTLAGIALIILAFLFYLLFEQLDVLRSLRSSLETRLVELSTAYANLSRYNTLTNHHLKEPVRKMQIFIDRYRVKQNTRIGPDEKELLDKMQQLSHRTYLLLEDLGAISELDAQIGKIQQQPVDLNRLVAEVVKHMNPQIKATSGNIAFSRQLPTICADHNGLKLLLQHLLENAMRFARPGVPPQVQIAAQIESIESLDEKSRLPAGTRQMCRITVADNGRGIAEEHREKVFQLFYRITEVSSAGGTGLGLALCQKIAALHGGFIHLQSVENEGSTFIIILPA